jgi:hypothetical protein
LVYGPGREGETKIPTEREHWTIKYPQRTEKMRQGERERRKETNKKKESKK